MFPSRYLALLLLLGFVAACSSSGDAAEDSSRAASGGDSSAAAVSVSSLTPVARLSLASSTPSPSQAAQPSAMPLPTETLIPPTATHTPTDTPTPTVTSTPTPTPTPTATPTPTMTPTPIVIDGIVLSSQEQALFAAHNQERVRLGVDPLRLNATLMDIARERAQTMAETGVFSHYGPNGDTVYDLLDDANYAWEDATENIHYNNVNGAVSFAMREFNRSPGHRANIIDPDFHRIGIGFVTTSNGYHYISVVFSD